MTRPDLATVPEPEPGIRLLGAEWGTGTFWNDLLILILPTFEIIITTNCKSSFYFLV